MARIRSPQRNIMKRAHEIAINAHNAHNADFKKVASLGVSTSTTKFFSEALKIAWQEEKTGQVIYQKAGKLPRKVMPRIHAELKQANKEIAPSIANGFMDTSDVSLYLGNAALLARHGEDKVTPEMQQELRDYVASQAHKDLAKAA